MNYILKNQDLTVEISSLGAEMQSVKDRNGEEYLWQGDPAYWEERAPILFPFCGRFWKNLATVNGVPCNPGFHGFLRTSETVFERISESCGAFVLRSNEKTLGDYPFPFEFRLVYTLNGNRLSLRAEVKNTGDRIMPYGYGGHPGFRIQYAGGEINDYYVEFPEKGHAKSLCFCKNNCFITGGTRESPMKDGKTFVIDDSFFATGSFFLCDMPKEISLRTKLSPRHVTLRYEEFPYLGFWKSEGGSFICIEPWMSLPANLGESTELTEKKDLMRVGPGCTNVHEFSIEFAEK